MTPLTLNDFAALGPLLILLIGTMVLLLLETFAENSAKKWACSLTLIAIALAIVSAYISPISEHPLLTPWLKFDSVARFFTLFFLTIGFGSTLLASSFFQRFESPHSEYYFLLLSSLFGLILIGASADFLTLFLGIETLSLSLYVLCGYVKKWNISHESAIKYFLMGSLAAGFLLYGIALIYGAVGTTQFHSLFNGYNGLTQTPEKILFLSGITLVTLALAFEAAIVPFQTWAPDVYAGAPTPVTALMAVGTKVGAFAAFVRVFMESLPQFNPLWSQGVAILAYPTLIYANIVALRQTQLRRFFAYSGIAQAGFMLIPIVVGTQEAISSLLFYLIVYSLATLGCFGVLAYLDKSDEGVTFKDLHGLFYRSPLLTFIFSFCLLTLAGIPPTAGFFAKFYLFKIAFQAGYYLLVIVALLTTILSAFYYLRIVSLMLSEEAPPNEVLHTTWPATIVSIVATLAIVLLSIYPAPLMTFLAMISQS